MPDIVSITDKPDKKEIYSSFLIPLTILIFGLIIAVILLLTTKYLVESGTVVTQTQFKKSFIAAYRGDNSDIEVNTATAKVSIDDDPIAGNKDNVKVAIVEFSDYECPFCKAYFTDTYKELRQQYVDTGKVIYVFRDSPLTIHDPLATKEALAAECVHNLAGNDKYFQYHNLLFENTTSNGNGMLEQKISDLAYSLDIDKGKFDDCYKSQKYKDEIKHDIADANKIGVNGTPGFVIGKLDKNGNVVGTLLKGSQSFDFMKSIIDIQLKA